MPSIFDAIKDSHATQRTLCRGLIRTREKQARADTFAALKLELEAHAAAEERHLYVPLLMTDAGLSSSRHALSEHHDIEELLEDLSVRIKSGQSWMATAKKLSEKVHHHLREEERKFFKVAGRLLSATKKAQLGSLYLKELERMRSKLDA